MHFASEGVAAMGAIVKQASVLGRAKGLNLNSVN